MRKLIIILFLFIAPEKEERVEIYSPGVVYYYDTNSFTIKPGQTEKEINNDQLLLNFES